MAYNKLPSAHIANISATSTALTLPLSSVPELSQAEVSDPTGDIRKVAYAFAQKLHSVYSSMLLEDRPVKWTSSRVTTAPAEDSVIATRSFTFTFEINNPLNTVGATDVVGES